jgi:hypothetical protein
MQERRRLNASSGQGELFANNHQHSNCSFSFWVFFSSTRTLKSENKEMLK